MTSIFSAIAGIGSVSVLILWILKRYYSIPATISKLEKEQKELDNVYLQEVRNNDTHQYVTLTNIHRLSERISDLRKRQSGGLLQFLR